MVELKNLCFKREKLLPPVYDQALRAMQLKLGVNLVKCAPLLQTFYFLSPMPLKLLSEHLSTLPAAKMHTFNVSDYSQARILKVLENT